MNLLGLCGGGGGVGVVVGVGWRGGGVGVAVHCPTPTSVPIMNEVSRKRDGWDETQWAGQLSSFQA